jgi:hypothetical protein
MSGHSQSNDVLEFQLPEMGLGDDPSAWPIIRPTKTLSAWWPGGFEVYANGLVFWRGDVWVSPRKFYDTSPPPTLTIYSLGGKTITVKLPRQKFAGFVKRLGQDPYLGCGGAESGQGSAYGPTLATLDGHILIHHDFAGSWETRCPRDPDYWPVGHKDIWFALEPTLPGRTGGRWALDRVDGGGLWLPKGVTYWPYQGTGEINYSLQSKGEIPAAVFSYTAKTVQYEYDPATWAPKWYPTPFGRIGGQDFGPNGEVVLIERNVWTSERYKVDPVIRVYK